MLTPSLRKRKNFPFNPIVMFAAPQILVHAPLVTERLLSFLRRFIIFSSLCQILGFREYRVKTNADCHLKYRNSLSLKRKGKTGFTDCGSFEYFVFCSLNLVNIVLSRICLRANIAMTNVTLTNHLQYIFEGKKGRQRKTVKEGNKNNQWKIKKNWRMKKGKKAANMYCSVIVYRPVLTSIWVIIHVLYCAL
jgi:hypothetical protein